MFVSNQKAARRTTENVRFALMKEICQVLQLIRGGFADQPLANKPFTDLMFLPHPGRV